MSFFFRFVEQSSFRALFELLRSKITMFERTKMIQFCQNHIQITKKFIVINLKLMIRYFLFLNV